MKPDEVTVQFRPATAADIPLLQSLASEIWRASYVEMISPEQMDYMLERMYAAYFDPEQKNLLLRMVEGEALHAVGRRADAIAVFQNVYDRFDPETGQPHYRADIVAGKVGEWVQSCPSTEGGHNWQAMTYHPPTRQLIIPLSQSCMEIAARKVDPRSSVACTTAL